MSLPPVEKNAPQPEPRRKYPWSQMEVGDSFYVPHCKPSLRANASIYGKKHGKRFSVRKEGDGKGCRVFRVA